MHNVKGFCVDFGAQVGARLREARESLGWSQQRIADAAGVRREMWAKYERGGAVPGGEVLAAIADEGVDLLYVLTGRRGGASITSDELRLIQRFRSLGDLQRGQAIALIDVLAAGLPIGGAGNVSIRNTSAKGSGSGTVIGGDISGTVIGGGTNDAPKRRR